MTINLEKQKPARGGLERTTAETSDQDFGRAVFFSIYISIVQPSSREGCTRPSSLSALL
jgi:hypothetical protein